MRSFIRGVGSVFLCAALVACSDDDKADDEPDPEPVVFPAELAAALQSSLSQTVRDGVSPGLVLHVSHPERGTFAGAAGVASIESGEPMPVDAKVRAGSILKPLIATAILQRVERGQLSLAAKLPELLPASITSRIPNAAAIDVRLLLSHRSGIAECVTDEVSAAASVDLGRVWTVDEFVDVVASQEPANLPDAAYFYSNTNYVLLGEILQRQTGKDWRDVVRDSVVARVSMPHSSLPLPSQRTMQAPFAHGYVALDDALVDFSTMDPSMALASGGHALITTTADINAFSEALFAGELFDHAQTLELMLTFLPGLEEEAFQTKYGLGVAVTEIGGIEYLGHLGRTAGYFGFTFHAPATRYTFSGFMNVEGDLAAFVGPVMEILAE